MTKHSIASKTNASLLTTLLALIAAHRPAFRQERPYRRAVGLVFAELFSFARHTVTQGLLALGLTEADWTGFYRLFSRPRFDEAVLGQCLLRQTLAESDACEPRYSAPATSCRAAVGYGRPGRRCS
jgi:hypothetical protein